MQSVGKAEQRRLLTSLLIDFLVFAYLFKADVFESELKFAILANAVITKVKDGKKI